MVALHGHLARGRGRTRLVGDPGPRGLGGLRPRRDLHRPADRVHLLPQALPRRPPGGGVRGQARPVRRPTGCADVNCPNCGNKGAFTEPKQFSGLLATHLGPDPGHRLGRVPAARRPRRASSPTSRPCSRPRARSRRSASPRSASPSATRSLPATSSSAPASSSRWRWSSSSSRARTRQWHEYWMEQRWNWYRDLGLREENMRWYEHPKEKLSHYSKRTADIEYRFNFGGTEFSRAGGRGQPHRLRPRRALQGVRPGPVVLRPGGRRALVPVRHRAGGGRQPRHAGLHARRLQRGRGAERQGRDGEAHRDAPRPAARPGQGRGAAAVPQPAAVARRPRGSPPTCARTGTSSSTTRAPSAAATAARTRSARRSASRSTSTPSRTTR